HRAAPPSRAGFGNGAGRVWSFRSVAPGYAAAARAFPFWIAALLVLALIVGCGGKVRRATAPGPTARPFRMGFSPIPPKPDLATALAALDLCTRRADAAILHVEPPWDTLLAGFPADSAVLLEHGPLAQYFRSKGLMLVVTIDATNGLDRSAE